MDGSSYRLLMGVPLCVHRVIGSFRWLCMGGGVLFFNVMPSATEFPHTALHTPMPLFCC